MENESVQVLGTGLDIISRCSQSLHSLVHRVAYMDHGARVDYIIPVKVDRGGAINLIAPYGIASRNCLGMATSGYLVDVQEVSSTEMKEWKKQYPEAFQREYDPDSGLRFNAWVIEEGGK